MTKDLLTFINLTLFNPQENSMITVFYDGKCGLCSREIGHYMKISPATTFIWRDIANEPHHLKKINVSQSDALRRLHVSDQTGTIYVGIDAFIAIWRKLPRWRLLALICAIPGVRSILTLVYNKFADWKFSRSAHCQLSI